MAKRINKSDLDNRDKYIRMLPIRHGCGAEKCACLGVCENIIGYVEREEYEGFVRRIADYHYSDNEIEIAFENFLTGKSGTEFLSSPIPASEKSIRPPIGLVPRSIASELSIKNRFQDVCRAIQRYYDAGLKIDIEWIAEYNELIDYFNAMAKKDENKV
jgi:hypothetical protein